MDQKNAVIGEDQEQDYEQLAESFDFDQLEEQLQNQLQDELSDLDFLQEEKEKIGSPDELGNVIQDIVWQQFMNQMATVAGEDFIKENNGLHLDLRKEAHIQTTENFAKGKIATHNREINYQERYDKWQSNFVKDENGQIVTHITRSGKQEATLVKGARKPYDDSRPKGSSDKHTDVDHIISAAEIIRDPAANAHMTEEERLDFANDKNGQKGNLNEMDSSLNRSKGDKSMSEWLNTPNSKGQKPEDIFDNMTEEYKKELLQKDKEAREKYEKLKAEAEERSIKAGQESRKKEAFRIGGKALRTAVMQLLTAFLKEVIAKLIKWFRAEKRNLEMLLNSLKEAIHSFVGNLKNYLVGAVDSVLTTIATAIIGPVVNTIKKVWSLLKQGWSSLKEAVNYLKSPENKNKPIGQLLFEVGKIVIAGLTGMGALILGEVFEKSLMAIPIFNVEIPLLGSLANILGIFLGAVVAGIIGAIAINIIEKQLEKRQKADSNKSQVDKRNNILYLQQQIQTIHEEKLATEKHNISENIKERHNKAAEIMKESLENIKDNCREDDNLDGTLEDIDALLKELGAE